MSTHSINTGDSVKFTVKLIGEPAPEVKWYEVVMTGDTRSYI